MLKSFYYKRVLTKKKKKTLFNKRSTAEAIELKTLYNKK